MNSRRDRLKRRTLVALGTVLYYAALLGGAWLPVIALFPPEDAVYFVVVGCAVVSTVLMEMIGRDGGPSGIRETMRADPIEHWFGVFPMFGFGFLCTTLLAGAAAFVAIAVIRLDAWL